MNKKIILILVVLLLFCFSVYATSVVIESSGTPTLPTKRGQQSLQVNSTGGLLVLYSNATNTYVAHSTGDSGAWTTGAPTQQVCDFAGAGGEGTFLINSTDGIYSICSNGTHDTLNVAQSSDSGTSWAPFITVARSAAQIRGITGVINSDDEIVFCVDDASGLRVYNSSASGTIWSNVTANVISPATSWCSLTVDTNDRYHMISSGSTIIYGNTTDPMVWLGNETIGTGGSTVQGEIGVDPSNNNLLILTSSATSQAIFSLLASTDGGASWDQNNYTFGGNMRDINIITDAFSTSYAIADTNLAADFISYQSSIDLFVTIDTIANITLSKADVAKTNVWGSTFPTFSRPAARKRYVYENATGGSIEYNFFDVSGSSTALTTLLEQPATSILTTNTTQNFVCSAIEASTPVALNISNVSYFLWDSANAISVQTDRDLSFNNATTANETFTVSSISDDAYNWNCLYTNNNSFSAFASSNFSLTVDSTPPTVHIELPALNSLYLTTLLSLNYTASDTNINSCVYSFDGGTTNTSLATCANSTITASPGNNVLDLYVNDTLGNSVGNQTNFTVINSSIVGVNELELEVENSLFSLFIQNGSSTINSADLFYNKTAFSSFVATSNGTGVYVNITITTPIVNDTSDRYINQTYYWNISLQLNGVNTTLTTESGNQTVYQKFLGNCEDSVSNLLTVNYSAYDEEILTLLSTNYSHIYSPLGVSGGELRSYNFSDGFVESSDVCIFPEWGNFTVNTQVQYGFNGTFDVRDYIFDAQRFSNSSRDVILLLLGSGASTDVIINVRDQNDNNLEDYTVEAYKFDTASNTFDLVQTGITDFSGKTLFQLDNSKTFRFILSKDGVNKLQKDNIRIIGTAPELFFVISIGIDTPVTLIDNSKNIDTRLFFNETGVDNAVNFTWIDAGDLFSQYCLVVTNFTISDSTEISNICKTSTNDRIGFDLTNYFNSSYIAQSYLITAADGTRVNLDSIEIDLRQPDRLRFAGGSEEDSLFFSMLVVATMGGIGLTTGNPAIAVFLTLMGVVVVFLMKMTLFTATGIIALVVMGGIVMYALKS